MPISILTAVKNDMLDVLTAELESGTTNTEARILLREGTTVRATAEMSSPSFVAATGGELVASPIAEAELLSSGDLDNFEIINRDEVVIVSGDITKSREITAVDTGAGTFTVAGEFASEFPVQEKLRVFGSTANNGIYTILSVAEATDTVITVFETIVNATPDGKLHAGPLGLTSTTGLASGEKIAIESLTITLN